MQPSLPPFKPSSRFSVARFSPHTALLSWLLCLLAPLWQWLVRDDGSSRPAFSRPAFSRPAFSRPAFSRPAFSRPAFSRPAFSRPVFCGGWSAFRKNGFTTRGLLFCLMGAIVALAGLGVYAQQSPPPGQTVQAVVQADNWIRNAGESSYVGDGIYNSDGSQQSRAQTIASGGTAIYHLKIENDALVPGVFTIVGPLSHDGWSIKYFDALSGGQEITDTGLLPDGLLGLKRVYTLTAGQTLDWRLEVTAGAGIAPAESVEVPVRASTISSDPTVVEVGIDVVKATTKLNTPPVALSDVFTTAEDMPVLGPLRASDADKDPLSYAIVTPPSYGSVALNEDGTFTYTPGTNNSGEDSFVFKANDGLEDSNGAIITIHITPVREAPVAVDDFYETDEDVAIVNAPSVLRNDQSPDGNKLTAALVSQPGNGQVVFNANGTFTYTPTANFSGDDAFSYQATDIPSGGGPALQSNNVAVVRIKVHPVNNAPVAVDDAYSTAFNQALFQAAPGVLANDSDPDEGTTLLATVETGPARGTLQLKPSGAFSYTPETDFSGVDTFTYSISDGNGGTASATVTITVTNQVLPTPTPTQGGFADNCPDNFPAAGKVLIYDIYSYYYSSFEKSLAEAAGHQVTLADAAMWSSMTTADFASYDAIVFPDNADYRAGSLADTTKAVWSAALTGPKIIVGTNPSVHAGYYSQADVLVSNSINFAASGTGTGLYVCLGANYSDPYGEPIPFLSQIGTFRVLPADCSSNATIVYAKHLAMKDLTKAGLSNWGCSVHEYFTDYPSDFRDLAFVDGGPGNNMPYIIATDCQSGPPPSPVVLDVPQLVSDNFGKRVKISWSVSDDSTFREYRLYRATHPGVTTSDTFVTALAQRGPNDGTKNSVYDNPPGAPAPGITYYYRVYVVNSGGNAGSNEESITLIDDAVTPTPTAVPTATPTDLGPDPTPHVEATQAPTPTPVPEPGHVDGVIINAGEADTEWVGYNVFNTTGQNQTKQQTSNDGIPVAFGVVFVNRGTLGTSFNIKGPQSAAGWHISYFDDPGTVGSVARDVTAQVTSANGWVTTSYGKDAYQQMRVEVTPDLGVPTGELKDVLVTAFATREPTAIDAVKAIAIQGRPGTPVPTATPLGPTPTPIPTAKPTPTPGPTPTPKPVHYDVDGEIVNAGQDTQGWIGRDIVNLTGAGQTKTQNVLAGHYASYGIVAVNKHEHEASLKITGPASANGWTLRYYDAREYGNDITAQVTSGAGWITAPIEKDDFQYIRLEVEAGSSLPVGAVQDVAVRLTSTEALNEIDVVRAVTTVSANDDGPGGPIATQVPTPDPNATPTPTPDPNATATPVPTATATPGPTPTAAPTPTALPTPTAAAPTPTPIAAAPLPAEPTVRITAPADGAEITAPTAINGTVTSDALASWELSYHLVGEDAQWVRLNGSSAPASGTVGVGATLDPTRLLNGLYEIRLTATDKYRRDAKEDIINIVVKGGMKIGHFTMSFVDMSLPVAGLPIQVTRTYDSREAVSGRAGDFGAGWTLDLSNIRVQKNGSVGGTDNDPLWYAQSVRGSSTVKPIKPRIVTVTFPGDQVYSFRAEMSPAQSPSVISSGDVIWTPQPGTRATLDALDGSQVTVSDANGPTALTDYDGSFYNPNQFVMTLPDGRKFGIKEGSGRTGGGLQWVEDLSGNRLDIGKDYIKSVPAGSSKAREVKIYRNTQTKRIEWIEDPRGNRVVYNSAGNNDLTSVTDREANTTRFTYDAAIAHYLKDVIDPRGPNFVPIRNFYKDGRLDYSLDALGQKISYSHDLTGQEEIITDRRGNRSLLLYDSYGNVTVAKKELKDANGVFLRWISSSSEYGDPSNPELPTKVVDALGHITLMKYTAAGTPSEVRVVMDPNDRSKDRVTSTSYDQYQHPLQVRDALGKIVATNTYWRRVEFWAPPGITNTVRQPEGALKTSTDANGVTTFTGYGKNGAPWQVVSAYGTPQEQRTTYQYDFNTGNLVSVSDSAGHGTGFSYDVNGNKKSQTTSYTPRNPDGSPGTGQTMQTGYVYDKDDRLIETDLPGGASSQTHYNAIGKVDYTEDALHRSTSYEYNERGERTLTRYADGTFSRTVYNADGMVEKSFDRSGRGSQSIYDSLGRTVASGPLGTDGTPILHADGTQLLSSTLYDDAGRATRSIDELGRVSDTTYNTAGEAITSTVYDADAQGNPVPRTTRTDYDAVGRAFKVTDALGRFSITRYDDGGRAYQSDHYDRTGVLLTSESTHYDDAGRVDYTIDASQHMKRMRYDALGRMSAVIQATQGQPTAAGTGQYDLVTSFGYDELGRKVSQQDANGRITRFGYDIRGRQVWRSMPGIGAGPQVETSSYNDGGQLQTSTDFRGFTSSYNYDTRGRMTLKKPDLRLNEAVLTWSYPDENTRIATRGSLATTYHTNPQRGWLSSVDSPNGTVGYNYDDGGQKTAVITAQGTSRYSYDVQGRLSQVSDQATGASSASTLATYGYDAVGNLSSLTRGNSVATAYTYDELNRLRLMVNTRGNSELSRFAYTVRDDGKRTGLNETLANNTAVTPSALPVTTRGVTYGYDDAGRLTGEIGNDGRGVSYENVWQYDGVGNRVGTTAKTATVAAPSTFGNTTTISATFNANDWLTAQSSSVNGGAASTQSWTYDANGAEKTHAYGATPAQENGWGFDGTLLGTGTQGTTSGGTSYTTDASGNRIAVTLNQGKPEQRTSKYLLDENTSYAQVLEERAPDVNDGGTSVLQARMVWGGGLAPVAMWRKMPDGSVKLFYFVTDGQESVRQLTDSAGLVTDSYYYDSWGNALAGGSGDTKNSFRYTGQMLDSSGKYFLRARYYDPSTGRFLSHDPVRGAEDDPVSLHRYLYASADGVNGIDPSGLETIAGLVSSVASSQIVDSSDEARSAAVQKNVQRGLTEKIFEFFVYWELGSLSEGGKMPGGAAKLLDSDFHIGIFVSVVGADQGITFDVGISRKDELTAKQGKPVGGFLNTKNNSRSGIEASKGGMSGCIATLSGAQYAAWIELAILTEMAISADDGNVESLLSGAMLGDVRLGKLDYLIRSNVRSFSKNVFNCVSWTVLAAGEAKALGSMK